ncbi:hypothetical protein GUJ93_ZPchr0008g13491 [Zizania palustris]|uniref:Uncharacterized protein n=1 Tax=Zizania palustris TaxID=103762 RepID=A0A8J5VJI2_ZIZPA|nr:hypothetical protein GUJ93_ZPchr0008g13491 [Zizania palustris]KAG8046625.1 hypothetical protein GUJ93_ZPchr0008g13491 [Zizania palustris]
MELYPGYIDDHFNIHKLSEPRYMTSAAAAAAMGVYGRRHQSHLAAGVWGEPFIRQDSGGSNGAARQAAAAMVVAPPALAEPMFDSHHVEGGDSPLREAPTQSSDSFDQEASKPRDKIQRRLAQNRAAARKSRLRKKAYIQNLETSRMKLAQLEQEMNRARQQGVYISRSNSSGLSAAIDSGVATFEMEYASWVEEQSKQTAELRAALQANASELQLRILVEAGLAHYDKLFRAKSAAAKADVFFVMSGMWRTAVERFFLWIAGFRPSELLKILSPQLEPMTEQQATLVHGLQQKARELEDALSQGMDKLQQKLADSMLTAAVVTSSGDASPETSAAAGCYMASAMGNVEALVDFVDHADHLRQGTLQNMYKILTARQAARGLLALGDYCQRLRALSSLWAARPREPA